MEMSDYLEKLLPFFERYYTIKKDSSNPNYAAYADFNSHNEQYFLVKSAKIADIDSNEFVYFSLIQELNISNFSVIDNQTWQNGLSRVKPYYGHRNSDVTLIIISNHIDNDCKKQIKKTKHYKSYKFSLLGWSNYKLVAVEISSKSVFTNKSGKDLKKLVSNIF